MSAIRRRKQAERQQQPATPPASRGTNLSVVRVQQQSLTFSGPVPPPGPLQQYREGTPEAYDFILESARANDAHEREMDIRREETIRVHLAAETRLRTIGMIIGGIVACGAFYGAVELAKAGMPGASIATVIGAIAALVGTYIYSRHEADKESGHDSPPKGDEH